MGAALAIIAAAQTALDRISDMRALAGALEVNADVAHIRRPGSAGEGRATLIWQL